MIVKLIMKAMTPETTKQKTLFLLLTEINHASVSLSSTHTGQLSDSIIKLPRHLRRTGTKVYWFPSTRISSVDRGELTAGQRHGEYDDPTRYANFENESEFQLTGWLVDIITENLVSRPTLWNYY